ncbi:MAG TPA: hypothetical protein VEC60_01020 [Reyranella sp.]|nr:hypothetical protein [Reyranella sp.]
MAKALMAFARSRGATDCSVISGRQGGGFRRGAHHDGEALEGQCQDVVGWNAPQGPNVDRSQRLHLSFGMEQTQAGGQLRRVDTALSRLESMVEERLRNERARGEELAARLERLEQQHEELKKVAMDVESRLERAMEYIRSLLAADQQ